MAGHGGRLPAPGTDRDGAVDGLTRTQRLGIICARDIVVAFGVTRCSTHRAEDTPLQRKKAIELQQKWGNKPCNHPAFSREYDLGERTGNYCCTQCGATITFRERAELMAAREAKGGRPRAK